MRTWFKTNFNTALILDVQGLRSYLKLICEYEFHSLPNTKVSAAKDHGKNYMRGRPPLVRHLLRNRLLNSVISSRLMKAILLSSPFPKTCSGCSSEQIAILPGDKKRNFKSLTKGFALLLVKCRYFLWEHRVLSVEHFDHSARDSQIAPIQVSPFLVLKTMFWGIIAAF